MQAPRAGPGSGRRGEIAFLPVNVLIVTLILHRILGEREKRARIEKLNMVVGVFFSEVGTALMGVFLRADTDLEQIRPHLLVTGDWPATAFARVARRLAENSFAVAMNRVDLYELRAFLLGLLESPTLLEHESFTDLLQAVFHLTEELEKRAELMGLPVTDVDHLAADIRRAYGLVIARWLDYMRHLKEHYPYLFSLAMRTNPFDEHASAVVR
jgi:hypothetical protein